MLPSRTSPFGGAVHGGGGQHCCRQSRRPLMSKLALECLGEDVLATRCEEPGDTGDERDH